MSFFKQETPAPEITGTQAIRARVHGRWKKVHLARTAMDLNISLPALEAFAQGGSLPEAALHALTKEFFMNVRFNPVTDRLIDTSPPPTPLCTALPEPFISPHPAVTEAYAAYRDALREARGPDPVAPQPEKPPPGAAPSGRFPKRPGFA